MQSTWCSSWQVGNSPKIIVLPLNQIKLLLCGECLTVCHRKLQEGRDKVALSGCLLFGAHKCLVSRLTLYEYCSSYLQSCQPCACLIVTLPTCPAHASSRKPSPILPLR